MFFPTVFTSLAFLSTTGWAQYVLEDDYTNGNFFDMFSFFNSSDPTHGFVDYVEQEYASDAGLINTNGGQVYMGVDHDNVAPSAGRPSVRITSTKSYNSGLVILDAAHMPEGCGTWPAFWMVGPNWPHQGEIDIIEGVNDQTTNDMTLHTGPGCSISNTLDMSGSIKTPDCNVNAIGQSQNAGCQIGTTDSLSYGAGFNANKGGVYATEWTDDMIRVFFFPRGSIPSDIESGSPDPSSWGKPYALFTGDCDIGETFSDLSLVFDTTFCGDWAGNTWGASSCSSKANTCTDFVKNNPSAFQNAYWSVNSLKVYQSNGLYSSKIVSAEPTVSSATVSAPVSATESSVEVSATQMTTFAFSTKPTFGMPTATGFPHQSLSLGANEPFSAGNATRNASLSGSGTGTVPAGTAPAGTAPAGTAPIGTQPAGTSVSTSFAIPVFSTALNAPSSPPEPAPQEPTPPSSIATPTGAAETQSAEDDRSSWTFHMRPGGEWEYSPVHHAQRHARHLRQHKRHAAGGF